MGEKSPTVGRCGGIGRHMAFKRPRPNGLVGSSPAIGNSDNTGKRLKTCEGSRLNTNHRKLRE